MKTLVAALLLAGVMLAAVGAPVLAQEQQEQMSAAQKKELFRRGAKLWPLYCNTCHKARPGGEKASYEWDQIIMHMRTLGNLPAQDSQALVEYLKAGK